MGLNLLFINSITMYGGGEVWMVNTMAALRRRGHRVFLMCRHGADILSHVKGTDVDAIPLRIRGDFDPITIVRVARFIKQNRIHVILTNMDKELRFAGMAAKLTGVKLVISLKGVDRPLKNRLHYRFTYKSLATTIVVNSEATKRTLLRSASWLSPDRVRVLYHGIDPVLFSDERTTDLRAELRIPPRVPLMGFVGRFNVQKGIIYLLHAFKMVLDEIPNAHLLMAGEGDLKDTIIAFAAANGCSDRLHLTGFRRDIANVMRTMDMLVLPSLWEGFGIVLIEAMAAKKPCVAARTSSIPEIVVHNDTGIIVPPKDAPSLARAMIALIKDKALAASMGLKGWKVVQEKFRLDRMIDDYEALFYTYP
ncbi:MAG: glycosyltransferase family 4 protein [bacterium]